MTTIAEIARRAGMAEDALKGMLLSAQSEIRFLFSQTRNAMSQQAYQPALQATLEMLAEETKHSAAEIRGVLSRAGIAPVATDASVRSLFDRNEISSTLIAAGIFPVIRGLPHAAQSPR